MKKIFLALAFLSIIGTSKASNAMSVDSKKEEIEVKINLTDIKDDRSFFRRYGFKISNFSSGVN